VYFKATAVGIITAKSTAASDNVVTSFTLLIFLTSLLLKASKTLHLGIIKNFLSTQEEMRRKDFFKLFSKFCRFSANFCGLEPKIILII